MNAIYIRWAALVVGLVFNAAANVLIKAGVRQIGTAPGANFVSQALVQPCLYFGVVSFALALGAYTFALSGFDLSIAYPIMTSAGLVIVAVASVIFFGEVFTPVKIIGTLLIMAGVYLLARAA
jgi:multidrug transporter EmrE-like cation transporter